MPNDGQLAIEVPASSPDVAIDVRLVEALRCGDPGATAALWDRFCPLVRRIIRRSVAADDVEDLVQDVFLRLFHRVHTLREPAALHSFVLTVTSSVVVSELRRRRVRQFLRLTNTGDLPEPPTAPIDDEGREALTRLYRVLNKCSAQERMAFMLKQVEGLELQAVATALKLSVATVKRRLGKVHDRLQKEIGHDEALAAALGIKVSASEVTVRGGNR